MNLSWFFLNTNIPIKNITIAETKQPANWPIVGQLPYRIIVLAKLINWYIGLNFMMNCNVGLIILISYIIGVRYVQIVVIMP